MGRKTEWRQRFSEKALSFEKRLVNMPKRILDSIYVLVFAIREFRRDIGLERAATLSFATILSLIPLTVLFVSFAGMLGGGDRIIDYVENKVVGFVAAPVTTPIEQPEIDAEADGSKNGSAKEGEDSGADPKVEKEGESPTPEKEKSGEPVGGDPAGGTTDNDADAAGADPTKKFLTFLRANLSRDAFRAGPTQLVNTTAIAALLIAALGLLTAAERIFNVVWKVKGNRGYLKRLAAFWLILTTSPFLIAASISIGAILVPKDGWLERAIEDYWIIQQLYGFVVPFIIALIGFTTIYLALPATRVRIRSAFVGGFVGSLLWSFSKLGFLIYVSKSTTARDFYGQLATLPLFLVWIYLSWAITIFGAEISYTHQNLQTLRRASRIPNRRRSRLMIGLELLTRVDAAQFQGLPPQTTREVASVLAIRNEDVESVAQLLVAKGILVEDAAIADRFVLARSAEVILVRDIAGILVDSEFPGEIEGLLEEELENEDLDSTPGSRVNAEAWLGAMKVLEGKNLVDLRSSDDAWIRTTRSVVEEEHRPDTEPLRA